MLVRESVNFIRGDRDEESVKTSLFGIRVGHIVIPSKLPPFPNSRSGVTMPAYLVESIHDEGRKRSLRLLGIGYFYNLNFRNPGDTPSQWFSFSSGFSSSLGDEEDYKPIDSILKEMILDSLKKEPERRTWEVHKMNFYDRSGGKPILLKEELFHRSSTKSQIKDKLIGFRPGSIITSTEPWPANKPYKEVYMYIKKGEKFNDQGNPIIVTYIGALSKRDGKLSQFLIRHKKMLGETVIWEENKRSLTPEELQKVQKTFAEIPSYRKKIYDETGIKPSLNESINFERGFSERSIKEKIFGWRSGQILSPNDSPHRGPLVGYTGLFAYIGPTEDEWSGTNDWVLRCLEVGHVSGNPRLAYIHPGFSTNIIIKRKGDLKIPDPEEIEAIQKALKNKYYQNTIERLEEKIGTKLFV